MAESAHVDDDGNPLVKVERDPEGFFRFTYHDATVFWLDAEARNAWLSWPEASTLETALIYFLGPVMTWILRLHGRVVLHASVVRVDQHAIVLAGPAGAGKSTTAAALVAAGHRLISDDTAAFVRRSVRHGGEDTIVVLPDTPRLRLWPEASQALAYDVSALPLLCADWEKRALDLDADQFAAEPSPVSAIYLLSHSSQGSEPVLTPLTSARAVPELLARAAAPELTDRERTRQGFDLLSQLAADVPIVAVDRASASAAALASSLVSHTRSCHASAMAL